MGHEQPQVMPTLMGGFDRPCTFSCLPTLTDSHEVSTHRCVIKPFAHRAIEIFIGGMLTTENIQHLVDRPPMP
jgi:hypothetical protein